MGTVKFNDVEEFLGEMAKDRDCVDRHLVRVTNLFRSSTVSPIIRHLSVVATARVGSDIVRLESYCGDIWQMAPRDTRVVEKAEQLQRMLAEGCARLGLEVRAGLLEEGE